jgi:hypothetical protein
MGFSWTPAIEEAARAMWVAQGLPASKIALAIGAPSRSAVLMKARRRKWPPHSAETVKLNQRRSVTEARAVNGVNTYPRGHHEIAVAETAVSLRKYNGKRPREAPPPRTDSVSATTSKATPRDWLTRKPGECARPVKVVGDVTYSCCAPIESGRSYCPACCKVMFYRAADPRAQA